MSLSAHGLCVTRGGRAVLRDVSFVGRSGRVTALLGPNGAGKSTLLEALAGLLVPHRGQIRLGDLDVASAQPATLARLRAVVSQRTELALAFTVRDVVALGCFAATDVVRGEAVEAALGQLDLLPLAGRLYPTLSGGEQQRVHLARALAQLHGVAPPHAALLLDEPTANLDLMHVLSFVDVCRAQAARGVAVVVVVHDLLLARALADDAVLLRGGRVEAAGPAPEVLVAHHLERTFGVPFDHAPPGDDWLPVTTSLLRPPRDPPLACDPRPDPASLPRAVTHGGLDV